MAQPDPEQSSARPAASDQDAETRPNGTSEIQPDLDDELYGQPEEFGDEEDEEGPVEWFDEQGRRHVRRAAPEGTEEILEKEIARETGLPDRVERWRQRSATGAVVTAFALGLQAALDTQREEPAIVMETSGEPPTDLPVEARLEQLGPRQSTVKVRTWLFNGSETGAEGVASQPGTVAPAADGPGHGGPRGQAGPGEGGGGADGAGWPEGEAGPQ